MQSVNSYLYIANYKTKKNVGLCWPHISNFETKAVQAIFRKLKSILKIYKNKFHRFTVLIKNTMFFYDFLYIFIIYQINDLKYSCNLKVFLTTYSIGHLNHIFTSRGFPTNRLFNNIFVGDFGIAKKSFFFVPKCVWRTFFICWRMWFNSTPWSRSLGRI